MSVVRAVKEVGPWQKEVSVEVPIAAVDAEQERVALSYRKKAKAPGFRKGKMPLDLVKRQFMEEIRQETLERIIPRFWNQAQAETQLEPLVAPQLGDVEWTDEEFAFVAKVEIRPEIEIRNVDNFDLPEVEIEPSDDDVEQALEALRKQASGWKPVERPAADGDMVSVKIRQGEAEDDPRPVMLEVGEETVWPELSEALRGQQVGTTESFTRPGEEEDGPIVRPFTVELLEVKEPVLPQLDDALAQKISRYQTLAELRDGLREQLRANKEYDRSAQRETAMLEQLAQRHPFDVPPGAVDAEIQEMLNEYAGMLSNQGVDLEKANIEWEKVAEDFAPRAQGRLRARLLLDAVAEHLGSEAAAEDLEAAIGQLARERKVSSVAMRKSLADSGRLESLRRHLRRRATVAQLLGEEPTGAGRAETAEDSLGEEE